VRALVLKDEALVQVAEDGAITTSRRRAVRVLTRDGRREADCHVVYPAGTTRVKDMRGFVLWPGGEVTKQGKQSVVDLALASGDLYNDVRVRVISASDEVRPGAVFGCETVHEDKSVFTQLDWPFQDELPVVASALSLSLPVGERDGRLQPRAAGAGDRRPLAALGAPRPAADRVRACAAGAHQHRSLARGEPGAARRRTARHRQDVRRLARRGPLAEPARGPADGGEPRAREQGERAHAGFRDGIRAHPGDRPLRAGRDTSRSRRASAAAAATGPTRPPRCW
jgi:hypothetical protein